jgi:NADH:ubiquinone oxidoreductase subunit 6 (subunit J)
LAGAVVVVLGEAVVAGVAGVLGAVTVFVGAVTVVVWVGAVVVVCWFTVVFTLVVWPTLSDWLVTVGLCLELFSETSRTITTIATIASSPAPMIANGPAPLRCRGSVGPPLYASGGLSGGGTGPLGPFAPAGGTSP